jgi:SAM-dependent methyltransferase
MPLDEEEQYETYYETALETMDHKIAKKKKRIKKKLKRFSRYRKTGNFLDVGCGAGAVLWVAKNMGWSVKGVDISDLAASYARRNFGVDVFTGSIEMAAYPDNFFDVVFTNASLEHLHHPLATMKECLRILRPGGIFYAHTVNWDSMTRRLLGVHWKLLDPIGHVHLFTPVNILSLCQYAGFEHVKTWATGVRVVANKPNSTFKTPWYWHLGKGPLSVIARATQKGDHIKFLARKPVKATMNRPKRPQANHT